MGMLLAASEGGFASGVGSIVKIFTDSVLPMLKTEPMIYFVAVAIFGAACMVFRHARRAGH
ncbi:MAG: hypothetical protein HDT39_01315 [Lachnospiraceae bacterium]|nr:hypothetical protein [Lachnospiraceae bacterium]